MQVREAITIRASVRRVFDVFTDLDRAAERLSGVTAVEVVEGPGLPLAVGTKWKETRVMMGKEATETMWVTAVDAPHGYVVEAESCGTHYVSTFTFTPTADDPEQTEAAMTFSGRPMSLGARLLAPIMLRLMGGSLRKMIRRDLEDLKRVCEADGSSG